MYTKRTTEQETALVIWCVCVILAFVVRPFSSFKFKSFKILFKFPTLFPHIPHFVIQPSAGIYSFPNANYSGLFFCAEHIAMAICIYELSATTIAD